MKQFLNFFSEARSSQASVQAHRKGWTGDGHGSWFDKEGNLVAKTVKGVLTPITRKDRAREDDAVRQKAGEAERQRRAPHPQPTPKQRGKGGEEEGRSVPTRVDGSSKEDRGDMTIVFGRFNPPTIGHKKLLDGARKVAGNKGALRIYPSRTQDPKKNPLDPDTKYDVMSMMFPDHKDNIVNDPNAKTIFDVLKTAYDDGYSNVKIVVGDDRKKEFEKLSSKYNGKLYDFKDLETISAGERDADSEDDLERMSASMLRKAAAEADFEAFRKGVPQTLDDRTAKKIFNTVRQKMKVNEGWNLWEIAPKFDWRNLRENYVTGKIFKVNELVENLNTGLLGKVIRRGTNYLICVTENNIMFKSWIKDLKESNEKEVKPAAQTGVYGVPAKDREVGTASHRKYAQSMVPGQGKIKNFNVEDFINKYKAKK